MAELLNLGGENAGFIGFEAVSGVEAESMEGEWLLEFGHGQVMGETLLIVDGALYLYVQPLKSEITKTQVTLP